MPDAPSGSNASRTARLRHWVVAVGTAAIVANAGSAAYDTWRSYRRTIDQATRELSNASRLLASQTMGNLRTVDVLLRETVEWYARQGPAAPRDAVDMSLAARAEGLPQLLRLAIMGASGVQLNRSALFESPDPDLSDRAYFTRQRDRADVGLYVSEPLLTRIDRHPVIALSRRLVDPQKRFVGIVAGYIDLLWLQRAYERVDLGPSSVIFVLRQAPEGTVLVLRVPPPAGAGTTQMHLELPPLERPGLVRSPIDGVERLVAGWRIDASPLVVGVSRDKDAVLHDWRLEAWRVLVRTLILSALGAAAIAALVRQLRRAEAGERALRDSEERYALAMDSANEGHYDWNMKGGSSFVSVKMLELLGLPRETQFADRDRMLESVSIHPDDMRRINAAYAAHMEGRSACYEVQYRVLHADGQWHWLRTRGQCLRDAEGRPDRFVGSTMEVTGEKRAEAERQRLEAALRKSQKMEAMGTLAGGIAHDFNNILGAILGYGEMAQKDLPQGSALRHYVDNVIAAGERAKALVERILTFSRSGLGARTPVNVQAVAQETLDLLAASLPSGVQLVPRLASGDAAVIGDPTQLHQVLMNLCTNAVHAMDDAGTLEVLLDRVEVREARPVLHGTLEPGPYVSLTVRDSGSGMDPQLIDRIFDPFFTTKGVGEGTGLGLSLVHGIVADIGGAIDVASIPGKGTTFTVWLPVSGSAPAQLAMPAGELPLGNGEVILLVDDEPALAALTEELLARLGYEPAGFTSAAAALDAFGAEPQRFDAVLTDERMPGIEGTALAMEIRRLRPDIPIVLMSGYSDAGVTARAQAGGIVQVVRKPLSIREIAECLAHAVRAATHAHSA